MVVYVTEKIVREYHVPQSWVDGYADYESAADSWICTHDADVEDSLDYEIEYEKDNGEDYVR